MGRGLLQHQRKRRSNARGDPLDPQTHQQILACRMRQREGMEGHILQTVWLALTELTVNTQQYSSKSSPTLGNQKAISHVRHTQKEKKRNQQEPLAGNLIRLVLCAPLQFSPLTVIKGKTFDLMSGTQTPYKKGLITNEWLLKSSKHLKMFPGFEKNIHFLFKNSTYGG